MRLGRAFDTVSPPRPPRQARVDDNHHSSGEPGQDGSPVKRLVLLYTFENLKRQVAGPSRCGAPPSSPWGEPRTHASPTPRAQPVRTCSPGGSSLMPVRPSATWQGVWCLPGPIQFTAKFRTDMFRLQLFQPTTTWKPTSHLGARTPVSALPQAPWALLDARNEGMRPLRARRDPPTRLPSLNRLRRRHSILPSNENLPILPPILPTTMTGRISDKLNRNNVSMESKASTGQHG
ncbi:hypothetical protein PAL_GLEAN10009281 [Pteropus alecto]|uniref:Uncharacterized protein n=1 Tax=Pteropus alecto TaxID=9402 RepID=L5KUS7_PTEAL|nr:hypothetical protein PAL_GLEAN10009281 [Pteropus alecto]